MAEDAEHARARTGFVMAVGEVNQLRGFLHQRAKALRDEADKIEAFLKSVTRDTQSWHDLYASERDLQK